MNKALQLLELGQSLWFDSIQRSMLHNGEMAGMIARGEIRGVTSNPTIFMQAITKSTDYDDSLQALGKTALKPEDVFFKLAIEDIQAAADLFAPLYQQTQGGDGYVSLEVSPDLAYDSEATLVQAKEIWQRVNRSNLMIKIPATSAGLPAITAAIAAGINVNATLIFSIERYREVVEAYLKGLEQRLNAGLPLGQVASVASFFVSRMDSKIDPQLQRIIDKGGARAAQAEQLLGKAAIANARLAYAAFKKVAGSARFIGLQNRGARVQRPLWASTSTKNPAYRDVRYVEELIGKDTVNTVPPQTLAAFLDHGEVRPSLEEDLEGARAVFAQLEKLGISYNKVTAELEDEGVKSFADAFNTLLNAIAQRRKAK
jgi:transaldolase